MEHIQRRQTLVGLGRCVALLARRRIERESETCAGNRPGFPENRHRGDSWNFSVSETIEAMAQSK